MSSLPLVFHCQSHPILLFICPFKNQLWTWSQKRLLDCQIGSMIYQKKFIFQYNNISWPEELLEEILSRLPVKSLTHFRCVQNSWSTTPPKPNFHLPNTFFSKPNSFLQVLWLNSLVFAPTPSSSTSTSTH